MSAFDSLVSDLKQLTAVSNETSAALGKTEGVAGKGSTLGGNYGTGSGGTIPHHLTRQFSSGLLDSPAPKENGFNYRKYGKQLFGRSGTLADLAEGDWRGMAKDAFQELQENPKIFGKFNRPIVAIGKGAFGVFQGMQAASAIAAEIELSKQGQTIEERLKSETEETVSRGAQKAAAVVSGLASAALVAGPWGFVAAAAGFAYTRWKAQDGENAEVRAQREDLYKVANKMRGGLSMEDVMTSVYSLEGTDKFNLSSADSKIQALKLIKGRIRDAKPFFDEATKKIGLNDLTGSIKLLSDAGNLVPWMGMPNDPVKIWSYQESARISTREWAKIGSARAGDRTGD